MAGDFFYIINVTERLIMTELSAEEIAKIKKKSTFYDKR